MKASILRVDNKKETRNNKVLGIQSFGDTNDYPQKCREIVESSGTGNLCISTYAKFIAGNGFSENIRVNQKNQSLNYILNQIAKDYALHAGFALHINYNSLYEISEIQHIPFETVRFKELDDNSTFDKIVTHWDWGRRMSMLKQFRLEDKEEFNIFNPDPETIKQQVDEAEGWENYKGQILYFSSEGELTYPLAPYEAVLTDMNTEEGISNVKNRNVKNNFLPSGMLIDKRNRTETDDQENALKTALAEFQTDMNACKLIYGEVADESEVPVFMPFETKNYDQEFTYTEESVQNNIGQALNIPPLLRGRDVGAGFGADLMTNSYNFYNNITKPERNNISEIMNTVLQCFAQDELETPIEIIPLQYAN